MAWDNITDHDRIKKILQKAILDDKIPNSYLFWGGEGVGKDALAIEFAKTVNCDDPIKGEDTIKACGQCKSCKLSEKMQNPNIELIFSLPAGKTADSGAEDPLLKLSDEQINAVREQIQLKAENPYHRITIPSANQIKISSVRHIRKKLMLSIQRKGRRVVIMSNADEMTTEASNAFLKTLEEPHENVTIILTTSRQDRILPTILSRCQQIHCEPIPVQEIANALMEKYETDEVQAKLAAAFSQGSFTRAVEFLDEDMQQLRHDVVDMLRTVLKKNVYRVELLERIDNLLKFKDRKYIERALTLLSLWLKDAYTMKLAERKNRLVNSDQTDTIEKFISHYGNSDFPAALTKIENSLGLLPRNVNQQLILLTLLLDIRQIFLEKKT